MSTEVKMVYTEVENQLSEMNSKTTTNSDEYMGETSGKIASVLHSALSGPKQGMLY